VWDEAAPEAGEEELEARRMANDNAGGDFITDKDIVRITRDELDQGRTKQELYEELSQRYDSKEYLAQIMSRVPETEARAKYGIANGVLVVLLGLVCMLNLIVPLVCMIRGIDYRLRVLDPVMALILLWLASEVRRMRSSGIYTPIALLSLAGVLQAVSLFRTHFLWGVASVLLFGATSVLSFYLRDRLRSDWTPAGPATDGSH
jgi:hypothetical protein